MTDVVAAGNQALSVLDVLKRSTEWLSRRDVDSPRLDAELLMAHALGVGRLDLYLQFDRPLDENELSTIRELIRKRGDHRPVAYLVGEREFFSLTFHVDERVLVPRPETEHLVEAAVTALNGARVEAPTVVDVGTGSGCVAIATLKECPSARGYAVDVSEAALDVARQNAERHEVSGRLSFLAGDLLAPLRDDPAFGGFDAIVSNPPYIVRGDPTVERGVRDHEPDEALYVPGEDPVETAVRIAEQALEALAPGGFLALEVGAGAAPALREALEGLGYASIETIEDLSHIERIVTARKPL